MRTKLLCSLVGSAVIAALATTNSPAQAASGGGGPTAFVPFFGFPPLTHNSSFVPFPGFRPGDPTARFPLGLCCVTGAAPTPAAASTAVAVENVPPETHPIPAGELIDAQKRNDNPAGIVILRGSVPHG